MTKDKLLAIYLQDHPEMIPGDYHDIEGLFGAVELLGTDHASGRLKHSLDVFVSPGLAIITLKLSPDTALTVNGKVEPTKLRVSDPDPSSVAADVAATP